MIGGVLSWPLAMAMGRRAQVYQTGVPVSPYMRFLPDFPKVHPNATTWKYFRRYAAGTFILCGYTFATYVTDTTNMRDDWYTRPDFKPKPAMVKDNTSFDDVVYQQMLQHNYDQFKLHNSSKDSTLYRLLWARDADWSNDKKSLYKNRVPA